MRRVAQAPSHYEIELHQGGQAGTAWRAVRRIQVNGIVPLKFGSEQAAQAYAERLIPTVLVTDRFGPLAAGVIEASRSGAATSQFHASRQVATMAS